MEKQKEEKPEEKEQEEQEQLEKKEKQEEKAPQFSEASEVSSETLNSEGFEVSAATKAVAPVLKTETQNLEETLQDVKTEKKEKEEQKYTASQSFHYSDEQRRYTDSINTEEAVDTARARQVNTLRETIMPKTVHDIAVDWVPRRDTPMAMVREFQPQLQEEIIKYTKEEKSINSPILPHDPQKEVKKYKIQTA